MAVARKPTHLALSNDSFYPGRRWSKRALFTLLTSALLLVFILALASPLRADNFILYTDTQPKSLPLTSVEGQRYLQLIDLLSTMGTVNVVEKSGSTLQIRVGKNTLFFRSNSNLVIVNATLTSMGDPVLVLPSGWMVPVDFVGKVFPRLTDHHVTYRAGTLRAFVTTQPSPRVFYEASKGLLASRIAIEVTKAVAFEPKREPRQITIALGDAQLDPAAEKLNYSDELISSISFDDLDAHPKIRIRLSPVPVDIKTSRAKDGRVLIVEISKVARAPVQAKAVPKTGTTPSTQKPAPSTAEKPAKAPAPPHTTMEIITIDVGHGGIDPGARSANDEVIEKTVVLEIARRLRYILQQRLGIPVYLTRETDADVSLDQRATIANRNHSAVFISLHCGFSLLQNRGGAQVYVYLAMKAAGGAASPVPLTPSSTQGDVGRPDWSPYKAVPAKAASEPQTTSGAPLIQHTYFRDWFHANAANFQMNQSLAELIQSELNTLWNVEGTAPRSAPLRPLANVIMPAVLVEVGNLYSATDAKQLLNPQFQTSLATAIANGIQRFKILYEAQLKNATSP